MKLNKRYRQYSKKQWLFIASMYAIATLFVIIFRFYGDVHSDVFIKCCVAEAVFAWLTNWIQKPEFEFYALFTFAAIFIGFFACVFDTVAAPAFFTYLITSILVSSVHFNVPLQDWFNLPNYVPDGLTQVDYLTFNGGAWRTSTDKYTTGLIYESNDGRKLVVSAVVPVNGHKLTLDNSEWTVKLRIKGTKVFLYKDDSEASVDGSIQMKPPYIDATWTREGNYELESEGIPLHEIKKVIDSMIPA
jgi:hypothetical protein